MSRITSTIAAAIVASVSFASSTLASDGNYYEGASEARQNIDTLTTHSISPSHYQGGHDITPTVSSGDYYAGASRPE